MTRSIFLCLLALTIGATPAAAQGLERAQAAYFRGDYDKAMQMMEPLANDGDRHAAFLIGYMYERGQGVSEDHAKAAEWYARAAELGHPHAQNNLGVLYKHGRGVSKDLVKAYKWFDLAASGYLPAELGHKDRAIANQQDIAPEMTSDEITQAKELAEDFRDSNENPVEYRAPRIR